MTVQTDGSLAAAETCSVTGPCHAMLMEECSTLWARGRWTVEGEAALAHRRLHCWQVDTSSRCRPPVEDVLELSPSAR